MPNQNKVFQQIATDKVRHSAFDLSRDVKTTFNLGELIPVFLEEVLPNDIFNVRTEHMLRFAPMLYPLMHRVDVYVHYFFVPNRIIWPAWEDFITGGPDGTLAPDFPTLVTREKALGGRLGDYLGIPDEIMGSTSEVSQLPYRAYQQIFNDYYIDLNIQIPVDLFNTAAIQSLKQRAWEKDYFTSSLPFAQRGPRATVPINTVGAQYPYDTYELETNQLVKEDVIIQEETPGIYTLRNKSSAATPAENIIDMRLDGDMVIDIVDLRKSSAIQRWLELSARGGSRYTEQLQSMFGIKPQDSRLQRAEYLGGGRQPVQISEVLATVENTETSLGAFGGHGISVGQSNEFSRKFHEHGYVMGLMSVMPRTSYFQGLHRHWSRRDKFDYYFSQFADLGEQEIKSKELYADGTANDEDTFGYQQRYAEYKYGLSTVHGAFRSGLLPFHLGRQFASRPTLSPQFIRSDPSDRIFNIASTSDDTLWAQLHHTVRARRPMPFFAQPQLS